MRTKPVNRAKPTRLPLRQPPRPLTSAAMSPYASPATTRSANVRSATAQAGNDSDTRPDRPASESRPVTLIAPAKKRSILRRYWGIGVIMIIGGLIAGCSALSSDTVRIVQSNADGTITAMNSTQVAMQSTDAILQVTAVQGATFAVDLATYSAQSNQMAAQLAAAQSSTPAQAAPPLAPANTSASSPVNNPTSAPILAANNVALTATQIALHPAQPSSGATSAGTSDPNVLVVDQAVLTKTINNQGCAYKPTTTFAMTDSKIYVVAQVHRLKKGTMFTATWSGTINHVDTWTSDYNSALLCVHFYVDPNAINMAPGAWSVTLSTANQPDQTINFTIADNSAATAAATP